VAPHYLSARSAPAPPHSQIISKIYTRNPTDLREKYRAALKFITQFDAPGPPDVYAFKVLAALAPPGKFSSVWSKFIQIMLLLPP
jgi:hypothetical protein